MADLAFITAPTVSVGKYLFTNVAVILQVEDTPLIEMIHKPQPGFMIRVSIYDSQGNYTAKVVGTTVTGDAAVTIAKQSDTWVYKLKDEVVFQIEQGKDSVKITAELYTPAGTKVSIKDGVLQFFDLYNQIIPIHENTEANSINHALVGLHLYSDGTLVIGAPLLS